MRLDSSYLDASDLDASYIGHTYLDHCHGTLIVRPGPLSGVYKRDVRASRSAASRIHRRLPVPHWAAAVGTRRRWGLRCYSVSRLKCAPLVHIVFVC